AVAKLGIEVSERTVSRLLRTHRRPPSQTWRTFLPNHLVSLASMEFSLDRRRNAHPTIVTRTKHHCTVRFVVFFASALSEVTILTDLSVLGIDDPEGQCGASSRDQLSRDMDPDR